MPGSDAPDNRNSPSDRPEWPSTASQAAARPSGVGLLVGGAALIVATVAAFLYCGSSDEKDGASQGITLAVQQPGQLPSQQQQRPVQQQQPPALQPQASAGDQIANLSMQFTQTLVRTDGTCPSNVPAAGFDLSPKTPTRVTLNKTKRTIQVENTDGTKSDVATYDAATGLALITYQGAVDNRTSTVKVSDTALDGESAFFPYRATPNSQQYASCKFVLKTVAKVV